MKFVMGLFFSAIFLFCHASIYAQSEWKAEVEKDGIKVYSRTGDGIKIKELKAVCVLDASVDEIMKLLLDVDIAAKWICHTKSCRLLKKVSENELYYHTEVSLPWPLSNRDFVTHLEVKRNPGSDVVTIDAPAVPGLVSEKKGVVRVTHSTSTWIITPTDRKKCKLEYRLRVDPGGFIPAWIVNSFACQAPVETFQNMRKQLKLMQNGVNG